MKKKSLILALMLVGAISGGVYAYTWTTASGTIGADPFGGDIADCEPVTTDQPDWESVLPQQGVSETLRPNAAGDVTSISSQYPDSSAHWDKVDEDTADDLSTYIYTSSTSYEMDLYNISDHSEGAGTINSVTVFSRFSGDTGRTGYAKAIIKTYDTTYEGNAESQTGTTFADESYTWTINPNTSSAWTWNEIDTLQAGVSLRGSSGYNAYCTQVYVVVDYTVISGEVPTGDLFTVAPNAAYPGDLQVHAYLTNVAALTKAYQYLNMKLYLQDSVEASQDPDYRLLTLENGAATFNLRDSVRESAARTWTQTSQADFEGGTISQLDTTSGPGEVELDHTSGAVTDSYNDETKVASKTDVEVDSGQVKLTYLREAGTETLRPNAAGDTTDIESQEPDSDAHWDKVDEEIADDLETIVYTDYTSFQRDLYNVADTGIGSGTINSVSVYYDYASRVGPSYGGIYATGYNDTDVSELVVATFTIYNDGILASPILDRATIDDSSGDTEPTILRIRDNVMIIAYDDSANDGWIKTIYVTREGQVTSVTDSLEFDTLQAYSPDIINVSGDIFAIGYQGDGDDGYLKTVEVSQDGLIEGAVIDTFEFDTDTGKDIDMIHVSGDIIAIVYEGSNTDGYIKTVEIDTDGNITEPAIDTFEYDTSNGGRPNIVHVSGDIYAITYEGESTDGYVKTVEIATDGQITEPVIDTLEFDTEDIGHPSISNISGDIYAIAYEGPSQEGRLVTIGIASDGQITDTVIDTYEHEAVTGEDPDMMHIYGGTIAVVYRAADGVGRLRTFEIAADGQIADAATDAADFDTHAQNPDLGVADIVGQLSGFMHVQPVIKTNGATYTGTEYSTNNSTYTTQSYEWTTNPYTGSAWTWSEIDSLQAGIDIKISDLSVEATVTQVYVVVDYSAAYNSTGTVTSINLLSGQTVCEVDSFGYNASAIPSGTTLKAQFSQDNSNWYNAAGTSDGWSTLSSGTSSISLSRLHWSGANFYYKMKFTSDAIDTPLLDEITVNYNSGYDASGTLASSAFDGGEYPVWNWGTISFTINEPTNTDIKFQIRSATTEAGLSSATWYGPTATDDYYTTSSTSINPVQDGDRWLQHKAYFSTSASCSTPTLSDISIAFTIDAPPYKIEIIGGSYYLISGDSSEWSDGWIVTPEFYCEVIQR